MDTILPPDLYTWGQFAPEFALVGVALVILLADTFLPRLPKQIYAIVAGLAAAIATCFMRNSNAFGFIICLATSLSLFLAFDYRKIMCDSIAGGDQAEGTSEFYTLALVACAGACCLTQARDLIMLFVSLETLTLSSYAMAGYFRRNQGSVEAGVKYLILGAMSTGLLVFGMAWYYGMTGTFLISSTVVYYALYNPATHVGFMMATALLLSGAFFKVGAAPLHVWIPDVYQGSPTPASSFLAVASKAAGFAVLCLLVQPFRPLLRFAPDVAVVLVTALSLVAAATLLIGNLGAIGQNNIKRLLGYSSIGQAGFILVFFVNLGSNIVPETTYYLLAYLLATVPAFFAAAMVRTQRNSEEISAFRGLGKTNPRTAFLITVLFASLAGVPLTMGFIAKLNSFQAFVEINSVMTTEEYACGTLIWLLPIMIICAAAGFYYYFKVLRAMYWEKPQPGDKPLQVPGLTLTVLTLCAIALISLGSINLLMY